MPDTDSVPTAFIETAIADYIECAMWSSLHYPDPGQDSEPVPLDSVADNDDLSDELVEHVREDVTAFVTANWADVQSLDAGQVGHDFWLTRSGHGAGFWDRGLGELGDRLTSASKTYGNEDWEIGDDGQIHV